MTTLIVTGFGAYPGVGNNPSAALMAALRDDSRHFARLGIRLEPRVLPVAYGGLAARLAALFATTEPDAVLHFGVAPRRNAVTIETRAHNRRNGTVADARGVRPDSNLLDIDGPASIAVRIPAAAIAARLCAAGIAAKLSRDAGSYLCNATLYETLTARPDLPAGFIHIPVPAAAAGDDSGLAFNDIVKAAEIAIMALAVHVRRVVPPPAGPDA